MIQLNEKELLKEVIEGVSARINIKALNEVIDEHGGGELNDTLRKYYERAHYLSDERKRDFVEYMLYEDDEDFDFIKESTTYGVKKYKKPYNYKRGKLEAIKQRSTGLVGLYSNGFIAWASYMFDVDEYVRINKIDIQF